MIEELNGDFLQWLRGFYYIAQTGSVRKAAELMHRNPSTISYQLKSLEEELGVVLFDRYKKSLKITPEGKNLLAWTISAFETLQDMRSSIGNFNGRLQGEVKIAATLPILALAAGHIASFLRTHSTVHITIERGLSSDVRKAVTDAEVDFGLLPVISRPDKERFIIVFKARPLLVINKENPWNIPPVPEVADLKKLPYVSFLAREGIDELGNYINYIGMGDFIQRNSVIQINNYHLILRFVWQKIGVSIMDEMCFQATRYGAEWANLDAIPLDHLFPNRLYGILSRRSKRPSSQAKALMDDLYSFFSSFSPLDLQHIWQDVRQTDASYS